MRQFHCDQIMTEVRTPLKSGRIQIEVRCTNCGQHEREIRGSKGTLWRWINLTVKKRLDETSSAGA
jgi:hypothetical protein